MPLFQINENELTLIRPRNFLMEKDIQRLIEQNLQTVFNCRLVATEFSTGAEHVGRIDTLALSEDNNPVIIEYKKVESSELINQSLFYLSWIKDHRGDFQVAAIDRLGHDIQIDWSDVRVICIAPGYKRYDLHAVQMMGANIELWQYRLFDNGALYLEVVFRRGTGSSGAGLEEQPDEAKTLTAGQKAAMTRKTGSYTIEEHLERASHEVLPLMEDAREYIASLDQAIEENPKKFYIAFKTTQNFVSMIVQRRAVVLYLKLDPLEHEPLPENMRDVRNIGHQGTGDLELTIQSPEQLEAAKPWIKQAFERVGG